MNTQNYSIKKRLLLWISIPIVVTSFLILLLAFLFSWREIGEVYDAQLVHTAKTLLQLVEEDLEKDNTISLSAEKDGLHHSYENKTTFRIWKKDKLILQSSKAKDFPKINAPTGFSDQMVLEKPWRFFVFSDPEDDIRVEMAQRYAVRYELITQLVLSLAIPMAIMIPTLLGIVWIGVKKSLKPLVSLSQTVDTRDSEDLRPIDAQIVPLEAAPLVHALNRLFTRISESFKREREFTDHAAHELRTPLAAMKTQTQVLMKKTAEVVAYKDDLENLNATIDRATHLIEQLLSFARLQNECVMLEETNLSDIVNEVLSEIKPRSLQKEQTITSNVSDNVYIKGNGDSLYIMIRNIIDNAVKYTPGNGTISVLLNHDGRLIISDTGIGIIDSEKKRVFERFIRVDKSGQIGSGLGLSMVQWIAHAHKATVTLKDNFPNGLVVEVVFNDLQNS